MNKIAAWTWNSGLPGGESFRIHIVPVSGKLEAIMGSGRTPVWPKGKKIDYLFLRRRTKFREPTRFVTVLEPFRARSFIREIKVLSTSPLVLEVIHRDGRDKFTVSPEKNTAVSVSRTAVRKTSTQTVRVGQKMHRSFVKKFDGEKRMIVLKTFKDAAKILIPGRKIRVFNNLRSNIFTAVSV